MSKQRDIYTEAVTTPPGREKSRGDRIFFSGLTDMPAEVYQRLFKDGAFTPDQVYEDGQELSPPMPLEDAAAYQEFKDLVEAIAEGMEELN